VKTKLKTHEISRIRRKSSFFNGLMVDSKGGVAKGVGV
jgi:hypothetical protein